MPGPNVTLRISGSVIEHLQECTGKHGLYETPSEYLRDLIRPDMEQKEIEEREHLRSALADGLSEKSLIIRRCVSCQLLCPVWRQLGWPVEFHSFPRSSVGMRNPVTRGYVDEPEHWRYSAARNHFGEPGLIEVCTQW